MIKAVFFDIDGTLADFSTHRITPASLDALNRARARGVKLFIATGRPRMQLRPVQDFAFDGYVTLNGQFCYTGCEVVRDQPIDRRDVAATVELISRRPDPCLFVECDRWYMNMWNDYALMAQQKVGFTLPEPSDVSRALDHDVYQMIYFVEKEREAAPLAVMPHCHAARWNPLFMDIMPNGGGKDLGLAAMLHRWGIAPQEAMAIGDGENDITMLQYAGIGVAMGNADRVVKEQADYVTAPADEDGVSKALLHFGII